MATVNTLKDIKKYFVPNSTQQKESTLSLSLTPDEWMSRFAEILSKHNLDLVLLYGTCLGVYRDKQIIKNDTDADFGLFFHELDTLLACTETLLDHGFYISGRGLYCVTYSMPNTDFVIDIWPIIKRGNTPLRWLGYRWICDHVNFHEDTFSNLDPVIYKDQRYLFPSKIETYLEKLYGPDWRTPKPKSHAGPRGLLSQWLNRPFVDFSLPIQFSGENNTGTYKPWVSKILTRLAPNSNLYHLFKHPHD